MGLSSIIGTKQYTSTNWEMVTARAFGFKNNIDFKTYRNETTLTPIENEIYETLKKRRKRENIIANLRHDFHLRYFSCRGVRGFYFAKSGGKTEQQLKQIHSLKTRKGKREAVSKRKEHI